MKYIYTLIDRDGGIIAQSSDLYDTPKEADKAGKRHIDDPRYGKKALRIAVVGTGHLRQDATNANGLTLLTIKIGGF